MHVPASEWLSRAVYAERRAAELRALAAGYVKNARDAGATWAEVGAAFGITRQAAHERFSAACRWRDHRLR